MKRWLLTWQIWLAGMVLVLLVVALIVLQQADERAPDGSPGEDVASPRAVHIDPLDAFTKSPEDFTPQDLESVPSVPGLDVDWVRSIDK